MKLERSDCFICQGMRYYFGKPCEACNKEEYMRTREEEELLKELEPYSHLMKPHYQYRAGFHFVRLHVGIIDDLFQYEVCSVTDKGELATLFTKDEKIQAYERFLKEVEEFKKLYD